MIPFTVRFIVTDLSHSVEVSKIAKIMQGLLIIFDLLILACLY